MIDWYVEVTESAPSSFNNNDYLISVIDIVSPFMEYFCKRLYETENWKLEDVNKIFKEIIDEMPIMEAHIWNDEFSIKYNRWVYIKLIDTKVQIYRDSKIRKLGLV
jgi:hypothetical protein